MSTLDTTRSRSRNTIYGFVAALVAAIAIVGFVVATSGGESTAAFTSTENVKVSVGTGGLELNKTGDIVLTDLVPGGSAKTADLTFSTEEGDVEGKLTIGAPFTVDTWTIPAGQTPDFSQVRVTIKGKDGTTYVDNKKLAELPPQINLGTLKSGAANASTVYVTLVILSSGNDAKDNQFKNVAFEGGVTGKVTSTA